MPDLFTRIQYSILRNFQATPLATADNGYDNSYAGRSKVETLVGDLLPDVRGANCVDYGSGVGRDAMDLAGRGAARVIGIEPTAWALSVSREVIKKQGLDTTCTFVANQREVPGDWADLVISMDAFEHFGDVAAELANMHRILKPGGHVVASWGPPWYHPLGGHLFSVFPWSHLIFTEKALIRWRSDHRNDGATRFSEVESGLGQLSIGGFEKAVRDSGFSVEICTAVPIRKLRMLHNRLTREFTTSVVRVRLRKT